MTYYEQESRRKKACKKERANKYEEVQKIYDEVCKDKLWEGEWSIPS